MPMAQLSETQFKMPVRLEGLTQSGYATPQTPATISGAQTRGTRLEGITKVGVQPIEKVPEVTAEKSPLSFIQRLKFSFGDRGGKKKILEAMGYKVYEAADGNFILSKDGQTTRFDEKGWSLKDLADMAGPALPFLGFAVGSVLGRAPIVAGAGAGAGAALEQAIGRGLGVREKISPLAIAAETAAGTVGAKLFGFAPSILGKVAPQFAARQLVGQAGERIPGFLAREAIGGGLFGGGERFARTAVETGDIPQALRAIPSGVAMGAALQPAFGLGFRAAGIGRRPTGVVPKVAEQLPLEGIGLDDLGRLGKISNKKITQLSEVAERKFATGEGLTQEELAVYNASRQTLREAIIKRRTEPSAELTPNEERMFKIYEGKIAKVETGKVSDLARRTAVMQEALAPGSGDTMVNVQRNIERALASPNPTPEERMLINSIVRRENVIRKAIVKSGGVDNFEKNTGLGRALRDYELTIGKRVEPGITPEILPRPPITGAVAPLERQPPVARLVAAPAERVRPAVAPEPRPLAVPSVEPITTPAGTFRPTPEVGIFTKEAPGGFNLTQVTTDKKMFVLLDKPAGKPETFRTHGEAVNAIDDAPGLEVSKEYWRNVAIPVENADTLLKTRPSEHLVPSEEITARRLSPEELTQLEREGGVPIDVLETGEVIGSPMRLTGEPTPTKNVYAKALTRELEKIVSKFETISQKQKNAAYLTYKKGEALGNVLPNKTLKTTFDNFEKELYNTAAKELVPPGEKTSFADYLVAKLAEDKSLQGKTIYEVVSGTWKETKFNQLIRQYYNWAVRWDNATPKDIAPYVWAVMEKKGIPNPDVSVSRKLFNDWQRTTRPKLQKKELTSKDIVEKLLVKKPQPKLTPKEAKFLKEVQAKFGDDIRLDKYKKPEFIRFGIAERIKPGRVSLEEELAVKEQKAQEAAQRRGAGVALRKPTPPEDLERALFKRKWSNLFKKVEKVEAVPKEPSLSPEEIRARIDPENLLSNEEFLTRYAEEGGFRSSQHFLNKINKLADEGDEFALNIKDSLSDEQIRGVWEAIGAGPEGRLIAEYGLAKEPEARTLLATPESMAGMKLEFPGAPEGFRVREPEYEPVSPEAARTGLERFAAERRAVEGKMVEPTARLIAAIEGIPRTDEQIRAAAAAIRGKAPPARLAVAERPPLPKDIPDNIRAELDAIPDSLIPAEKITLAGDGGRGRKITVRNPLKMGIVTTVGNEMKTAMATADLSHLLRQMILVGPRHPDIYLAAFPKSLKFMFSEKSFAKWLKVFDSDSVKIAIDAENPTFFSKIAGAISEKEESFMAQYIQKIPILGKIVKASERAFHGVLNSVRLDLYKKLLAQRGAAAVGNSPEAVTIRRQLAEHVGALTGRGLLDPKGIVNRNRAFINAVTWSPGLLKSRLYFLDPRSYLNPKIDPFVRKENFKVTLAFVGTITTMLGIAAASGIRVGTDINSTDFGKMRFGKTRIDLMGGFQQYIVALSRLITGNYTTTKGKKIDLTAGGLLSRYDIALRFFENKEAPLLSFITTMLKGTSFDGQPVKIQKEILNRITPIVVQDLIEIARENPELLPAGILSFLGAGVQTYK